MTAAYDRPLVERLLPAVWDRDAVFGIENLAAPDPDMPRAKANPETANTLYAHLADIYTGWVHAPLTLRQRQALLLRYGLDWTQKDIARQLGIGQPRVLAHIEAGIGVVTAFLNQDQMPEGEFLDA